MDQLFNKCLASILTKLPLNDLVETIPLVCSSGNRAQKEICGKQSSLILLSDLESVDLLNKLYYHYGFRKLPGLGPAWLLSSPPVKKHTFVSLNNVLFIQNRDSAKLKTVASLGRTFPNLRKLVLFRVKVDTEELQVLLYQYIPTLQSLSLIELLPKNNKIDWIKIWPTVDAMKALRSLSLYFECGFAGSLSLANVMSQLEELNLGFYQGDLLTTMRLVSQDRLKRLALVRNGRTYTMNEISKADPGAIERYMRICSTPVSNPSAYATVVRPITIKALYMLPIMETIYQEKPELTRKLTHLVLEHDQNGKRGFLADSLQMFLQRGNLQGIRSLQICSQAEATIDELVEELAAVNLSQLTELRFVSLAKDFFSISSNLSLPTVRILHIDLLGLRSSAFVFVLKLFPNLECLILPEKVQIYCNAIKSASKKKKKKSTKSTFENIKDCVICRIEVKKIVLAFGKLCTPKVTLTKEEDQVYQDDKAHRKIKWTLFGGEPKAKE